MWNQRYGEKEYFYGKTPNDFLFENTSVIPQGGNVLCIAEGEGRNAVFLATIGAKVTAVDFSEQAKQKALQLAEKKSVSIHYDVCPLENYNFGENKWDAVVSIFAHLPSVIRKEVYKKIVPSLKVGGVFIVEAYNPKQLKYGTGGPKDIDMLCTSKIFRDELPGLEWTVLKEQIRPIQEGIGHQGMSSVVQGIGIKKA